MSKQERFDAIIIGSGQGGNPLATALANAGRKTALIESKHVGGTCINEGCTPTKTMVASAQVAYLAGRGSDYGVQTGAIGIDLRTVRDRKRKIVESFRSGSQKRLESNKNIGLIFGQATFSGEKTVSVALNSGGERTLQAEWIFINTGCRSVVPKIEGISEVPFLDNVSIMELDAVPEHLLVLGGGYIGVEFGQMFRRFGSRVTIIQAGKRLLQHEDEDITDAVQEILTEDGMELLLSSEVTRARREEDQIVLDVKSSNKTHRVTGSHLLLAAGRIPNTGVLRPDAAGIQLDEHGYIKVNEFLETNVSGIYALGDVKGGPAFTHISYDDYRILQSNLLKGEKKSTRDRMVPYTVFIDPELGRIGMTETEARTEARKSGKKIRIATMPMTYVARAIEKDETRGFMKVIVDEKTEQILGAAILGIDGGEVASMLQIAMMGNLPYTALRDGTFSHPTLSESLNNLFFKWKDES